MRQIAQGTRDPIQEERQDLETTLQSAGLIEGPTPQQHKP
jgi:hypothetical protein